MKLKPSYKLIFWLLIGLYALYAAGYIYRTSFVVEGQRYFVLFDDAMISMQYARNLAHGDGLVWNAGGERVEGFSNPLWVAFLALFHLFPIPAPLISLPVQISGALFFIASLFVLRKIAEELSPYWIVPLLAVFLTAFYEQFSVWSLLGMEVSALLLLTNGAVLLAIRGLKSGHFSPWLYILLGIGTLVRLDMVVLFLAILVFMLVFDRPNRLKHLIWGLGMIIVFLGGQTLLRWWYYGEWLPNTYYLKVTGVPRQMLIDLGVRVFFSNFAFTFNLALLVAPLFVILLRWRKSGIEARIGLLLGWVFTAFCAYSVFVGGDAWESKGGANRFISTGLPLYFVLLAYLIGLAQQALAAFGASLASPESQPKVRPGSGTWLNLGAFAIALFALVNFNASLGISSYKHWLLLTRHPFVPGSERYVRISQVISQISTPEARVAVLTAGIIPYYTERPSIDMLGKCDRVIARMPMRIIADQPSTQIRPGHQKWDYGYSIGMLKPDIVAQVDDDYGYPKPYLDEAYTKVTINSFPLYFRTDSPFILWDIVDQLKDSGD